MGATAHPSASRPRRAAALSMGVALLATACASGGSKPPVGLFPDEGPALVWPQPPDSPRIELVRSLSGPRDLGIRPSFLQRTINFVTGNEERRILHPHGVAVDSAGRIFVADMAALGVHEFDTVRGKYRFLNKTSEGGFTLPVGVAVGPGGMLFVSDAEQRAVIALDADGDEAWRIAEDLGRPAGLVYHAGTRQLYVIDVSAHAVRVYDASGSFRFAFGTRGTGPGELNFPTHITVDDDGTIYVTDSLNFRVQSFRPDGSPLAAFGEVGDAVGDLARPKGVALDSDGHVYVIEGLYDALNIFDRAGTLLLSVGSAGTGRGEFWLATGLAIDTRDRIYVADSFNGRIQVFRYLSR